MIAFDDTAWIDYLYFKEKERNISKRIDALIKDCLRNPFVGIGKPEPLKENLKGYWSRRITSEHRFVYKFENNLLIIASCRFHYNK